VSKAKYRAAYSIDGDPLAEMIGGIGRPTGQWKILYYGITVPIGFVPLATPPPPPPPP
jgi:hypothetical protein